MTIGSTVRRLLGPRLERAAADGYRRMFVDLDALAATIAGLGSFCTVIEVGCGEGALLTRLMDRLGPSASALGIDIAPNPGHGYEGHNEKVAFRQSAVAEIVAEGQRFDLVVVSDVLHHIPPSDRVDFLQSCRDLLAPNGTIAVKEWVRRRNLAHLAAYGSDRYISGDKGVEFYTESELEAVFTDVFRDEGSPLLTSYSRPHWNNVVLATTRTT
jgi:2-polyprenyl-3-methyl-5-hydroxy-6-metoxy-1,4-benzoquinol methylase